MSTETLRPNAAGDETNLGCQTPASTYHWDKVDEAVADDATTTVYGAGRDLYNLPASAGSGTITKITVHIRCKKNQACSNNFAYCVVSSGSTVDEGDVNELATEDVWEDLSQEWAVNPDDSEAWEWADIDALQIGVRLAQGFKTNVYCTQVYVEVDYTAGSVTSIKTVFGTPIAEIKTINGVPIANVKSVLGVSNVD